MNPGMIRRSTRRTFLKTAAAALLIAALPIVAIRLVMGLRPRKC